MILDDVPDQLPATGSGTMTSRHAKSIRTEEPGAGSVCLRLRGPRSTAAPETRVLSPVRAAATRVGMNNMVKKKLVEAKQEAVLAVLVSGWSLERFCSRKGA